MMSGVPLETCWAFNERWNNLLQSCILLVFLLSNLRCTDPWVSNIQQNSSSRDWPPPLPPPKKKHVHQIDNFAIDGELHVILNNTEGKQFNWILSTPLRIYHISNAKIKMLPLLHLKLECIMFSLLMYVDVCCTLLMYAVHCWCMLCTVDVCCALLMYAVHCWCMLYTADVCCTLLMYAVHCWCMLYTVDVCCTIHSKHILGLGTMQKRLTLVQTRLQYITGKWSV